MNNPIMEPVREPMSEAEYQQEIARRRRDLDAQWRDIGKEILHWEIEKMVAEVRLRALYLQLPTYRPHPDVRREQKICPSCTGLASFVDVLRPGGGLRSETLPCLTCGGRDLSAWKEAFGVSGISGLSGSH